MQLDLGHTLSFTIPDIDELVSKKQSKQEQSETAYLCQGESGLIRTPYPDCQYLQNLEGSSC